MDCQNKPPPIPNCPGTWACPDEVCEFTPDTICDEDAGTDAGPSLDAETPDASAEEDAAIEDAPSMPPPDDAAAVTTSTDAGQTAARDTGAIVLDAGAMVKPAAAEDGCSCETAGPLRPSALVWLILVFGAVLFGRRRLSN